jgi:hypothetical protein
MPSFGTDLAMPPRAHGYLRVDLNLRKHMGPILARTARRRDCADV